MRMRAVTGRDPWVIIQIRPEAPDVIEAFEIIENVASREEAIAEFLKQVELRWSHHPIYPERLGAIRMTAFDGVKMDFNHRDLISYCSKIGLSPSERKALLGCFEQAIMEACWREREAQAERETGTPISRSMWGKSK